MTAICSTCGYPIRYVGPYWLHAKEPATRHIAKPDRATMAANDDRKQPAASPPDVIADLNHSRHKQMAQSRAYREKLDSLSDVIEDANVPDGL